MSLPMPMPASRLVAFVWLGFAAFGLSACFETTQLTEAVTRGLQPGSGPSQVSLLGGTVVVAGPAGYCVDIEATTESDIEAFVLLVRCRGTLRPSPVLSATVTSLESDGDPESLRGLTGYLQTAPGRAQLSRSGDPRDVTVEQATFADGVIWLLIHDNGNPRSFDETYWRAILPVGGRIVTLSVLASSEHPLDQDSGLAIMRGFVTRLRAVNHRR